MTPAIMDWLLQHAFIENLPLKMHAQLQSWKSGEKMPTFNQLENLSRATGIPFGYFFLQTPPDEQNALLNYRTLASLGIGEPSRNLIDTIQNMENIQGWMHDHLVSEEASPVGYSGSLSKADTIQNLADILRNNLGIVETWYRECKNADDSFRKIKKLASQMGVLVMTSGIVENNTHRKLAIAEFRAFTLIDDYAPLVFINSNDSKNGKLFSLLHELVHIGFGRNNFYNDRGEVSYKVDSLEQLCNAVAAEILVPQKQFLNQWETEDLLQEKIQSIAYFFRCGETVIARRALDNSFISKNEYSQIANNAIENFYMECERKKESGSNGGDFYTTAASRIDHRFFIALQSSLNEGKTPLSVALRLSNTNRKTFDTLAKKIFEGIHEY
jgi:Zn-dependent peptidase ImmA (M78 family)